MAYSLPTFIYCQSICSLYLCCADVGVQVAYTDGAAYAATSKLKTMTSQSWNCRAIRGKESFAMSSCSVCLWPRKAQHPKHMSSLRSIRARHAVELSVPTWLLRSSTDRWNMVPETSFGMLTFVGQPRIFQVHMLWLCPSLCLHLLS